MHRNELLCHLKTLIFWIWGYWLDRQNMFLLVLWSSIDFLLNSDAHVGCQATHFLSCQTSNNLHKIFTYLILQSCWWSFWVVWLPPQCDRLRGLDGHRTWDKKDKSYWVNGNIPIALSTVTFEDSIVLITDTNIEWFISFTHGVHQLYNLFTYYKEK